MTFISLYDVFEIYVLYISIWSSQISSAKWVSVFSDYHVSSKLDKTQLLEMFSKYIYNNYAYALIFYNTQKQFIPYVACLSKYF